MELDIKWTHLKKVLEDYGRYFIELARKYLGENKSYASGTLGDTMEYQILVNDERVAVGIELEDYWYYVEKGRKKGKFPPPPKILEWIMVKPVNPKPDDDGRIPSVKSLAYLIGRKIAKEGTDPKPFFERAKKETNEHFQVALENAVYEDVEEYLQRVIDEGMKGF